MSFILYQTHDFFSRPVVVFWRLHIVLHLAQLQLPLFLLLPVVHQWEVY